MSSFSAKNKSSGFIPDIFMMNKKKICVLSGLVIPANKVSREHYYPKSKLPRSIANISENIFYAHTTLNNIKRDLLPCQWYDMRWELTYKAIEFRHISNSDKNFLQATLKNWCVFDYDPCELCIGKILSKYCLQR